MRTQKASGPASRPRIPLEKRIVVGTIFGAVGPDYCNLALPDGRSGRLHKARADIDLQDRWGQLWKGDRISMFLLRPTEHDPQSWFLSQRWTDREANPWFRQCPQTGKDVSGRVVRYVADYAAIVILDDTGIEAFLHRARVPGVGYDPIAETLYVGDRVRGRIIRVNTNLLEVEVDLQPVIKEQWGLARTETERQKRAVRESGETTPSPQRAGAGERVSLDRGQRPRLPHDPGDLAQALGRRGRNPAYLWGTRRPIAHGPSAYLLATRPQSRRWLE